MRLIVITVAAGMVAIATPAQASAPRPSLEARLQAMSNEQKVVFAIQRITKDKTEILCAKKIAYKESRYSPKAKNTQSSARGAWQLLWGKPSWSILKQAEEANKYVLHRYHTWCEAYKFHQERNWY